MYKITIAENIPSLNKGELALLKGIIESFSDMETEVKIISGSPEFDSERYGDNLQIIDVRKTFHLRESFDYSKTEKILVSLIITMKHIAFLFLYKMFGQKATKVMKSQIWKEYINSDVIIVGHNGTFGIGGGLLGNVFNFLTFQSFIYLPFFGKTLKKPVVIYGSSISSYSFIVRKWMSFLLNRIDLITLRENKSLQNLLNLGYTGKRAHVTADLAFLMNPDLTRTDNIIKSEKIDTSSVLIGVTVTRYKAITAYKELGVDGSYEKHSKLIADVVDQLIETKNAQIVFLPHSIGLEKKFDDRILSEHIFQNCKNKNRVNVIKTEYSPEDLKSLMGRFDLFIGERLHSVIGAMSMGVPSLVLSNITDQRLEIIKGLGQGDSICYVENLDKESLISNIDKLWAIQDKKRSDLEEQIKIVKEKSMENGELLKKLLS